MDAQYSFHTMGDVELAELMHPDIFENDVDANTAARECLETQHAHFRKMLALTRRAAAGSILSAASAECENKLAAIGRWLSSHEANA